jgi:glucokinase
MARSIGVLATHYIWVGIVEDTKLEGVRAYPDPSEDHIDLKAVPVAEMLGRVRTLIKELRGEHKIDSVGAGFPGIICEGVIEDSPNLGQLKGLRMGDRIHAALLEDGLDVPVRIMNDADALAAGIAATHPGRDKLIRVWYLGDGVGFGRYPHTHGIWEAGHTVVSIDPKERFCGCGGQGHLEGILGTRSMRQRFLDMEPEEVFAAARHGNSRAKEFVNLWHRALAAATATNVHLDGPGRIYIAGPNSDFVDMGLLNLNLQEMVRMSPLQGTYFEIVPTSHDLAMIGAAVSSSHP